MRRFPLFATGAAFLLAGVGFLPAQAPETDRAAVIAEQVEAVVREHRETTATVEAVGRILEKVPGATIAPAEPEADIEVSIQGPSSVNQGGFALIGKGPEGSTLRWRIQKPDGSEEPLRLLDAAGNPVLAFFSPAAGRYVVTLTAQIPVDGLDPFGEASHVVTVGGVPPVPPVPPDPTPPPVPDLTGTAKAVYEAARGLDKSVIAQASNAYGSQVSAINAGAYNALALETAKQQIVDAITADNPPRNAAPALFDLIDAELQKREEAGQFTTLAAISQALAEITKGLESASK